VEGCLAATSSLPPALSPVSKFCFESLRVTDSGRRQPTSPSSLVFARGEAQPLRCLPPPNRDHSQTHIQLYQLLIMSWRRGFTVQHVAAGATHPGLQLVPHVRH
jgi:hypothetical protein